MALNQKVRTMSLKLKNLQLCLKKFLRKNYMDFKLNYLNYKNGYQKQEKPLLLCLRVEILRVRGQHRKRKRMRRKTKLLSNAGRETAKNFGTIKIYVFAKMFGHT